MTHFEFFSKAFSEILSYFSNKINRLKIINFKKVGLTLIKNNHTYFQKIVPNIDKYWLLAGPWTVFMHDHVWSFNQSQTRKSRTGVWTICSCTQSHSWTPKLCHLSKTDSSTHPHPNTHTSPRPPHTHPHTQWPPYKPH